MSVRYEERLKAAAAAAQLDERHHHHQQRLMAHAQSWREMDGVKTTAVDDRRHDDRKRPPAAAGPVKDEEWFHGDDRMKTEARSRYDRANKYDAQQLIGPALPDRSVCSGRGHLTKRS